MPCCGKHNSHTIFRICCIHDTLAIVIESFTHSDQFQEVTKFFAQKNAFSMVLLFIGVVVLAFFLSRYVARALIWAAQKVAIHADNTDNELKSMQLRQVETYLSIAVALIRALIVAVVAYITWRILSPTDNPSGVAAIGASAFFVVFAGQTLGMLLRDITSGAMMITEQWFSVGDHIKIEPFPDLTGVVERFNLRSTKLRSLSGEVIWVNNQHIQAVHVTPRGLKTMAVDVFTRDEERAVARIKEIINTIPTGTMMLASPLRITRVEKWASDTTRITIVGQTAPGREWLIEQFLVNTLADIDDGVDKNDRLFLYKPFARFADEAATKKFKRAVRAKQ